MKGRVGTLIRFDVSSLPAGAWIAHASLGLHLSNFGERTTPIVLAAYQVLREWEEEYTTWLRASRSEAWGVPGCGDTSTDRKATPLDLEIMYEVDQWYTWAIGAAVQEWVRDAGANKGIWIQQTNTEVGGEYDIRESEYHGENVRPYLMVWYSLSEPNVTATPTATPSLTLSPTSTPSPSATITNVPTPTVGLTPAASASPTASQPLEVVLAEGEDGYSGAADTFIRQGDDGPHGSDHRLLIRGDGFGASLIRFELPDWMDGGELRSAELRLRPYYRDKLLPATVGAYRIERSWDADKASWTRAGIGVPWTSPGVWPDDCETKPLSEQYVDALDAWYSFDITAAVRDWLAAPEGNFGVLLRSNSSGSVTIHFSSTAERELDYRPRLVVSLGGPITPALTETATPISTATATLDPTSTPTATTPPITTSTPGTPLPTPALRIYLPLVNRNLPGTDV